MKNPFSDLYKRCNTGTPEEKHESLTDGPIMVDIEPVGLCNFRCVMCPTGLQATGRPVGFMTKAVFRSILEKTEPFKSAIRFIGWGEPTMHPDLCEFIEMAADDYGRLTHINTNGSKITPKFAENMIDSGLASIKFSFQGIDAQSYLEMRRTDFFGGMIGAIKMMQQARGYSRLPWIAASTTTTTETQEQIEAFRSLMEPIVDELSIGHTTFDYIDFAAVPPKQRAKLAEAAAQQKVEKRHPVPCPEVWDKLSIHWDGTVAVCCNSYGTQTDLGNIGRDDFDSIWRHPQMVEYRERLSRREYGGPLCGVCYEYMPLIGK